MTRRNVLSPWAKWLAIAVATLAGAVAQAQTPQVGADADPPVRVGRMSYVSGDVSYSPAGNDEWVQAQLNRPIVTGDRLWADNGARAEIAVDDSAWWLGEQTSVTVSNLDDRVAQFQLQQGTLDFRVRRLPGDNVVEVDTPNLAFTATQPGRYRIQVDPQSGTTSVIVRSGGGEVYGESASYVVGNGEGYRFGGTDLANSEAIGAPPADAFDQFVDERDGRYDRSASVRYVSPEVVGYEDLDTYGTWSAQPSFGNVWFPRTVSAGWAPYREGHWAWIDPWGWTWVDDAPWGFAPFHYGRWSHFDRGWGWVPGPRAVRAVYAPALVAFIGGAGFSISVSSGPAIGWFPLAPREVYRPPYNVSGNYFRQVNVSNTVINNTTNITNIYNDRGNVTQVNYVNMRAPNAVTAVAPAAFAQSQNVGRVAVALPAAALQRGQVQTVARVAPAAPAFLGAAPAARVKPPAATIQRAVVAKAPPPPPPLPDARKLPTLEKNPGQPLNRQDVQALRAAAPAAAAAGAAPAVRVVVTPRKPAANEAPPSRRAGAGPSSPAAPPATGRGPEAKEPPAARAPEAKGPPAARAPEANVSPAPRAPEAKGPVVARPPEPQRNVIRGPAGRPAEPQGEARVAPPVAAPPPAATPSGAEARGPESRQKRGPPGAPESTAAPAAPSPEARQQMQRGPIERSGAPQAQPRPEARAAPPHPPEEAARPAPPARQPEARPAPQARPAEEAVRPAPQARQPEARPAPQAPPRPEARAAPPRPAEEAARPAPPARPSEARPAPQAQPRPSPQAKPPEAQPRGEGARPAAAPEPRQQAGKGNENKDGKDDKKDKDKP